jgi:hypothetical protein
MNEYEFRVKATELLEGIFEQLKTANELREKEIKLLERTNEIVEANSILARALAK